MHDPCTRAHPRRSIAHRARRERGRRRTRRGRRRVERRHRNGPLRLRGRRRGAPPACQDVPGVRVRARPDTACFPTFRCASATTSTSAKIPSSRPHRSAAVCTSARSVSSYVVSTCTNAGPLFHHPRLRCSPRRRGARAPHGRAKHVRVWWLTRDVRRSAPRVVPRGTRAREPHILLRIPASPCCP